MLSSWHYTPYVWPPLVASIFMAAVALYARRGVNAHAVALFRVFLSMLSLFALCNAMEISASSLALKVTFRSLRVLVDRPLVPFPLALTLPTWDVP